MKKIFITALLLMVCGLLISCKSDRKETHPWEEEFRGKKPTGLMNAEFALGMTKAYQADKGKSIIESTTTEDALSVWFSLQTLKHYIWKIEDALKKQGCNLEEMDLGLHIYYAKYPDSLAMLERNLPVEYALRHTSFLTATYKDGKSNVDFDPWHIGDDKCKPTPLSKLLEPYRTGGQGQQKMMMKKGDGNDDPSVLNQGTLSPPPANSGVFPEAND